MFCYKVTFEDNKPTKTQFVSKIEASKRLEFRREQGQIVIDSFYVEAMSEAEALEFAGNMIAILTPQHH